MDKRSAALKEISGSKVRSGDALPLDLKEADLDFFPNMTEEEKAVWRREIHPLMNAQILKETDRRAFLMYCQAVVEYDRAVQGIRESGGEVVPDKKGSLKKNPWCMVRNQAHAKVQRLTEQLGMTPKARNAVGPTVGDQRKEEKVRAGFAGLDA